jgi:CBS domain-containing protein
MTRPLFVWARPARSAPPNPVTRRHAMKISECMTRDVKVADPNHTIQDAAKLMAENDFGSLPVGENDRLIGMITDRDIAVRAIARGKGLDCTIREAMSPDILYCFEDQEIDEVLDNMGDIQVRRLPVLSRDKRLVGIISLGDLDKPEKRKETGDALSGITRHGGEHSQAAH